MLLQYKVRNYRCFADEQVLSLVASSDKTLARNTVAVDGVKGVRALKSALIYGPNGSGKSSIVDALAVTRALVLQSATFTADQKLRAAPFRLDAALRSEPTSCEVTFVSAGVRYEYGLSYTDDRVHEEWLHAYPQGKRQLWFKRTADRQYKFGPGLKGEREQIRHFTADNQLFLSKATALQHVQLGEIHSWFAKQVLPFVGSPAAFQPDFTNLRMKDARSRALFAELMRAAGAGIDDVRLAEVPYWKVAPWKNFMEFPNVRPPEGQSRTTTIAQFVRLDRKGEEVPFDFSEESFGTQTLYAFLATITDALQHGHTVIFDEQLSSIHPHLLRQILEMFHRSGQGQIILTTHDTNLLDLDLVRRDQIYFAEKDKSGRGKVYTLADFSPRKDEAIGKGYLAGRYGAIPFLGSFPLSAP